MAPRRVSRGLVLPLYDARTTPRRALTPRAQTARRSACSPRPVRRIDRPLSAATEAGRHRRSQPMARQTCGSPPQCRQGRTRSDMTAARRASVAGSSSTGMIGAGAGSSRPRIGKLGPSIGESSSWICAALTMPKPLTPFIVQIAQSGNDRLRPSRKASASQPAPERRLHVRPVEIPEHDARAATAGPAAPMMAARIWPRERSRRAAIRQRPRLRRRCTRSPRAWR